MAVEGGGGKELWRRYTAHEIYGLNCQYDINKDGVKDCLSSGRAGTFLAVSGKDGAVLWELGTTDAVNPVMNFYTPQYIGDINGDNVADIVTIHGGDPLQEAGSAHRLSGRIMIVSGRTGEVVRSLGVPDNRESYYSPQLLTQVDGVQVMLFGTGGETHNGSLWRVEVQSLKKGLMDKAIKMSSDTHKGFMTPPSLVDITQDGVEDIIIPMFNSTLLAIDGRTYLPVWSVIFPMSESYSTPAVGFYNDDDVPDFLVKYAYGPGYPVYYYSETTVIDGKTGKKLIDPPLRDTIGSQSSPLSVAMEGAGNDVFIVWMADCKGHEGSTEEFSFVKGTKDHEKSRANLCRLRFKSNEYSRLVALGRNLPKLGVSIYNSDDRKTIEHSKWVNTTAEAYEYIMKHPEFINQLAPSTWAEADNGEYQRSEALDTPPEYTDRHRTSSKKGPGGGGPVSGRKKTYKQGYMDNSGYPLKGDNANYNQMAGYNQPQNQGVLPYDEYVIPYKDTGKGYYGTQYGPYFSGDDTGDYYKQGYPYRTARKRTAKRKPVDIRSKFMAKRQSREGRWKRHVGPHDDDGLQRLLSTGVLAPTTLPPSHPDYNRSIDIIFATYWFFPANTHAILPQDQKCIAEKLAQEGVVRNVASSPYFQLSHEEYEEAITKDCLKLSDHLAEEEGTYSNSDDAYNPLDLNMGQMTVYRLRLKFSCSKLANSTESNAQCANLLPFSQQKWGAYMGTNGDSHWTLPKF
ncbi:uncharacterized protein LOC131944658 isoform X2 [Physella acuta]|uniref:uncharacterized protein LOC131944658 isoform X2 n=1 Tax=Physella acuta TaxID=109671 RepID=UPI0027DCEB3A|nr:uncharacterized protein LOC131944658 isoform X2 [Physella acuta]